MRPNYSKVLRLVVLRNSENILVFIMIPVVSFLLFTLSGVFRGSFVVLQEE